MKIARVFTVFAAWGVYVHAQFYAPDTEFHDIAQRTFPVEAARVLAWHRNRDGAGIAEIKYEITTTPERETVWTLHWLDAAGKVIREKVVRYPDALLLAGPKYFRDVFQQISGEDWKIKAGSAENLVASYWQGAAGAGVSRLEAVSAANLLISAKPGMPSASEAARLAGILIGGAMPSIANSMTLDSRLVSRGAAWLCIAEAMSASGGEATWAPILF